MNDPRQDPTSELSEIEGDSGSFGGDARLERLMRDVAQAMPQAPAPNAQGGVLSTNIGPYRILETLGRGGMGVVYLAEHVENGQMVALKTISSFREGLLTGLRREIQALTRIRHPGVVRILGQGVHDGVPWFAMDRIEGLPLRSHCARLGSLRASLVVVRRLCAALGYLHGEGIVHRDLKPGNILVRDSEGDGSPSPGWPVLMDFGLISRFGAPVGREILEIGGGAGGTVAYMAPEQAHGQRVDARADLYSLGCILYELVTGRPPFVGSTSSDVLRQHLTREPPPPSALAGGVPDELDTLILGLLAKRPQDRIGYADDVSATLDRLGATDGTWPNAPSTRSYLYRPDFAGRAEVMEEFRRRFERLDLDRGALMLVGGVSGVGKTRLLVELARVAQPFAVQVLAGEGVRPLGPVLRAIADRFRGQGAAGTGRVLGPRAKILAAYEPALAELPGFDAWPDPIELTGGAARTRLFHAIVETLTALDGPVLLILDDLQFADELTLDWLGFLVHSSCLERTRVLIVGTYRLEETTAKLQALIESGGVTCRKLEHLAPVAVGQMVGDMLAVSPPPEIFAQFLATSTEGNPFFVSEYLRTALAEQVLFRDEVGQWRIKESHNLPISAQRSDQPRLPDSIPALVMRRLAHLSESARRILDAASVLGPDLNESLLAGMTSPEDLGIAGVEELLTQQFFEEIELGRLRFVHDKIREVTYGRIPQVRRRELHEAAARAMETQTPLERERSGGTLGRHWELAGALDQARVRYLEAARKAVRLYTLGEADTLFRRVIALSPEQSESSMAALRELSGDVMAIQGRHDESIAMQLQALEAATHAQDLNSQLISLRLLGSMLRAVSRIPESRGFVERALELARRLGDVREEGRALSTLSTLEWERGDLEASKRLGEQSIELSRLAGDRRAEGNCIGKLAVLLMEQGRMDEARALFPQAISILHEVGDRRFEGMHLGNLANLHLMESRFDEALTCYEASLERLRESGERRMEGTTLSNLAQLHQDQGRIADARATYERALAIHREVGNRRFEANTLRTRAVMERRCGQLGPARNMLQEAEAVLRQLGDPLSIAFCISGQGHLELAEGRPARTLLEEVAQMAESAGVGSESDLARTVARLRRAVEDFETGMPLWHGECLEDVPEPLRRGFDALAS